MMTAVPIELWQQGDGDRRCLENDSGVPLCGAEPVGAFVVEHPYDVTCAVCLVMLEMNYETFLPAGQA